MGEKVSVEAGKGGRGREVIVELDEPPASPTISPSTTLSSPCREPRGRGAGVFGLFLPHPLIERILGWAVPTVAVATERAIVDALLGREGGGRDGGTAVWEGAAEVGPSEGEGAAEVSGELRKSGGEG